MIKSLKNLKKYIKMSNKNSKKTNGYTYQVSTLPRLFPDV